MLVGRLGMPEVGGSYFTFSNENNDLIWGFLEGVPPARLAVQGPRLDAVVRRAAGPASRQMEMNEGYADREDPGLTVRFPLVDRPGEALLVWTTTPWTLTVERRRGGRPGPRATSGSARATRSYWLGKGTLKQALAGPFEVLEERPGAELVGWRYAGPFDELPAVRDGVRRRARHRSPPRRPTSTASSPGTEVGEDEGTGHRPHRARAAAPRTIQLGKALGLPVIAPLDESGIVTRRASAG